MTQADVDSQTEQRALRERRAVRRRLDRSIAHLAIPALGALIAEPMFLIVDSALVGHLGATPLAGLAVAAAILQTAVGLMVFLAYATTPLVARRRGAGDLRGAVQAGVDGLWLAVALGSVIAGALAALGEPLIAMFHVEPHTAEQAITYLTVSCWGLPAMLLVFAATGLLRGVLDTRTPLAVATLGFALNAALNWWFMFGLDGGIAGSAWGTVAAQWAMVVVYLWVVARHVRRAGASFLPRRDGLGHAGRSGGWLFLRTAGMRVALLATVYAATGSGTTVTASYQVVFTIFTTAAFALDALAIAAQALVGESLGARNAFQAKLIVRRTLFWGVACGAVFGLVLAGLSPVLGGVFTSDAAVVAMLPGALLIVAVSLPLGGYVFVLDGVLIGAGDSRYLAWAALMNLVMYLPVLLIISRWNLAGAAALMALTAGFTLAYMLARACTLGLRSRGDRWVRLGI